MGNYGETERRIKVSNKNVDIIMFLLLDFVKYKLSILIF